MDSQSFFLSSFFPFIPYNLAYDHQIIISLAVCAFSK
jgi:hypothetical protein